MSAYWLEVYVDEDKLTSEEQAQLTALIKKAAVGDEEEEAQKNATKAAMAERRKP